MSQKIRPDMDIGQNIRRLRKGKGFTQEMVIARMNVMGLPITQSTYSKLETNRMNIRVSELVALKNILSATYEQFFEGLG